MIIAVAGKGMIGTKSGMLPPASWHRACSGFDYGFPVASMLLDC